MSDKELCAILYDLHTTTPVFQTEEERSGKILVDADYSKVDIDDMVDDLNVAKATKQKIKQTLKKVCHLVWGRFRHIRYVASGNIINT